MHSKRQAVFFDLDGTLLDTAPDLYLAMINTLNDLEPNKTIDFETFRPSVHEGTKSMILVSFGIDESHTQFSAICEKFIYHYQQFLNIKTQIFLGMEQVLDRLDEKNIPWGIVTNKPAFLTKPLIQSFKLHNRCSCIVSGDTLALKKPDPAPLLYACQLTQVSPTQCSYVGDVKSDVTAAKAAHMEAIGVLYGYHNTNEDPKTWGADYLIDHPNDLLNVLHF